VTATLDGKPASYWHDIPLSTTSGARDKSGLAVNFVCEVPKGTSAKMEVSTTEPLTPIRQDRHADGSLRHYPEAIEFNYGMLPMTWEDPAHGFDAPNTKKLLGDGDPLDVVEIGSRRCLTGSVHAVRPLGVCALVDGGELDFKVIAIRCDDTAAKDVKDIGDVERVFPGLVDRIMTFFRTYKLPKQVNRYAFGGEMRDARWAWRVIHETHQSYISSKQGRSRRRSRPRQAQS
jgi:inorganic pyrophosphatase